MAGPRPASRLKSRKQRPNKSSKNDDENTNADDKIDEAELKKPLETSVVGLMKALQVLQNASTEIKDYLSNECDIIYECRVCRSLFRSLANFIAHKRTYCQDVFSYQARRFLVSSIIITLTAIFRIYAIFQDEEQLFINSENSLYAVKTQEESESEKKSKDLSSIIERLGKRVDITFQANSKKIETVPFTPDVEIKNILSLQNTGENHAGMFQTITENNPAQRDIEFMKTEVSFDYNLRISPLGGKLNLPPTRSDS